MAQSLTEAGRDFLTRRHLATLTTLRRDGTPHVVPVGFTYDAATATAWVICGGGSQKAANARAGSPAALCQVEGRHWLTLEGPVSVHDDAPTVAEAVRRYAARYREPRVNPERVALAIAVTRLLGAAELVA